MEANALALIQEMISAANTMAIARLMSLHARYPIAVIPAMALAISLALFSISQFFGMDCQKGELSTP